jgi:hypothetical protein
MQNRGRRAACPCLRAVSLPFGRVSCGKISPAMVEPEELPEFESPQITNVMHADVKSVHAELVRMRQADAEFIRAEEVEMQNSAAANVKAGQVTARQSGLGMVNATEARLENAAAGFVRAENASVSGYTAVLGARSADIHHSAVGYLAAKEVHAEDVRTVVLLARNVNGNITTTLDTRGVVIAGLIGGLFGGLMLLLGRFLLRRS